MSKTLQIELVPIPLFRKNLRYALSSRGWQKIRSKQLETHNGRCDVCGQEIERRANLHEEWEYEVEGEKGVARITDLKFVCFYCHGCEHFGWLENVFARLPGTREDVVSIAIDHYCEVNGVGPEEFEADEKAAYALWRERNKLEWEIDWGEYEPLVAATAERRRIRRENAA